MGTIESALKAEQREFLPDQIYSVDDYLRIEDKTIEKHEFRNGKIFKRPEQNLHTTLSQLTSSLN